VSNEQDVVTGSLVEGFSDYTDFKKQMQNGDFKVSIVREIKYLDVNEVGAVEVIKVAPYIIEEPELKLLWDLLVINKNEDNKYLIPISGVAQRELLEQFFLLTKRISVTDSNNYDFMDVLLKIAQLGEFTKTANYDFTGKQRVSVVLTPSDIGRSTYYNKAKLNNSLVNITVNLHLWHHKVHPVQLENRYFTTNALKIAKTIVENMPLVAWVSNRDFYKKSDNEDGWLKNNLARLKLFQDYTPIERVSKAPLEYAETFQQLCNMLKSNQNFNKEK